MPRETYVRPVGLVAARQGREPGGFPLAGGAFEFTGYEILRRTQAGVVREATALAGLVERDWQRDIGHLAGELEAIVTPRPRVAGLDLSRPRIMGVVNVTPDSFSDGGHHDDPSRAIEHALRLVAEGADLLDIGGESTRPGSEAVALDVELARVMPVIEGIRRLTDTPISVDTRKAAVMRAAADAGADILNDVSSLNFDPDALGAAASLGLPVVLMHARGDPKTMQANPSYTDVALDVFDHLSRQITRCEAAGVPRRLLIADPGIGFGKTRDHNLELMAALTLFHALGVPLLVGASRKRFIGEITGVARPVDRAAGSIGAALAAAAQGAQILRVHDVAGTRAALDVWLAATTGGWSPSPHGAQPA